MVDNPSGNIDPAKVASLEHLLDRQQITDCMVRFSRGMDRFDRALFLSAFHSDAVISAGDFVGGPVELYDWASGLHEQGQSATHHNLLNHSCELDGETAHSETYYLFVGCNRDNTNWLAGGRYIDRFERRSGEWKIALRCNAIEWSSVLGAAEIPFADVVDGHLNGVVARSAEDISYLRPLLNRRKLSNKRS
ncbi:MAG: nuclear transport factor 2 family protein [Halioglobus sp.]|nr:nuclear transport factor 2 family protein [Halioglobus sp.]